MWSRFIVHSLLIATFTSTALSWPRGRHEKGDPPLTARVDIDPKLLDHLGLMAQYSTAAYRTTNSNSIGGPLICGTGDCKTLPKDNCPRVEAAKAYTADEFQDTFDGDDHGKKTLRCLHPLTEI